MNIFYHIILIGRKYWFYLIVGLLAMLAAGLVTVLPSYALKIIVDILAGGQILKQKVISLNLIPNQLVHYGLKPLSIEVAPSQLINLTPLILTALFLIDGVFRYIQNFNNRYFGVLVAGEMREQAYSKLMQMSFADLKKRSSGDLVSCLTNDLNLLQTLLAEVLSALISDSVRALALGIWLLILDWKLSLIGVIVFPAFFLLLARLSKRLRKLANQSQEITAEVSSIISETVQGANLIYLFNIKDLEKNKFQKTNQTFIKTWKKQLVIDSSISPILGVLSAFGIGPVIWFGCQNILKGTVSVGDFSSYLIATILLYQPIKRLVRVNAQISQINGTCQRIFELINLKTETSHKIQKPSQKELSIEFENVNFAYHQKNDDLILKNINLKINEGEKIAIVGSSGSGKSSLIALIARLYEVNNGQIKINNLNIQNWDLTELMSLMAFIPQDPFLFRGSIKDNLLIAKANASDSEIKKALELAKVDFLEQIQGGLNGEMTESGNNLSGGQRQRLSIARAFLKNSPLLILDEPTSSLDQESEELIRQSLKELMKDKTVILVTHKLSVIRDFPRIICMEYGQIVEQGSNLELINLKGHYYKLINAQN